MWLGWVGVGRLRGASDALPRVAPQLYTLGGLVLLGICVWFVFGFSDKLAFDRPVMLLIALLALPIFVLGAWSLTQLGPARQWSSVTLRVLVLLLIVSMLAGFRTVQTHDELTVVALIDNSESVRRFFKPPTDPSGGAQDYEQWLAGYLKQAGADKPPTDYWALQTFDGRPTIRLNASRGDVMLPVGVFGVPQDGSNGKLAIDLGMTAKQRADSALRMLLVSDGNLDGDVIEAVQAAAAAGVKIDVLPLLYEVKGEVMIEAVRAPTEARKGQPVRVSVELRSADKVGGELMLKHNGRWVDLNGAEEGEGLRIDARRWQTRVDRSRDDESDDTAGLYAMTVYIQRPITRAGVNSFDAVFIPDEQSGLANAITTNDRAQAFTLVSGPGKVLVVDGVDGEPGRILPTELARRGIDTDLVPPSSMPSLLSQMRDYDAILLHNVAAEQVSPRVQANLTSYVHNLGGGFVMIGGPDSFGAGGWTNTDIDKYLLPVHCQIPLQKYLPSGALMLVIDRSGSMSAPVAGSPTKQQNVAAEAAVLALKTLYSEDIVGVVSFDTGHQWIVEPQFNKNPDAIAEKIRAISSGGGTNIAAGVEAAFNALSNLKASDTAIKHMIVITDGQGQYPDFGSLSQRLAKEGITVSTVGVGIGHDSQQLTRLAKAGRGNYYGVNNPKNLPQVFIKEARSIRRNLIREERFTPTVRAVASPIMTGIRQVPPLRGFVLTGPKDDELIYMPIVGNEGEPIFAHHQVGLGRAAAFTADASNKWAREWLDDWGGASNYADFWARTVRQIARPAASTQADLTTTIDGDTLTLRLDAAAETDFNGIAKSTPGFGNSLDVRGSIESPDGTVSQVRLEQVGPGIYEARLPADQAGNYIVDLIMAGKGGEQRRVIGGASKAPGGELRDFQSNLALLTEIAERTGGRVLDPNDPAAAQLYDRTDPIESTSSRPLRWQLMPLLLAVLLMDVACRRIAWEGREVADWTRGRVNAVLGIMTPRKVETRSTMAALKAKRQQTADELSQQAGAERKQASGVTPPLPTASAKPKPNKRKFVASTEQLASAKDDFSAAVGSATQGDEGKPATAEDNDKHGPAKDQGPTTSRLLDAKRRAQQRMNDTEE